MYHQENLDWPLEYAAGAPPLPRKVTPSKPFQKVPDPGAYLVKITPVIAGHDTPPPPSILAGVLRIRRDKGKISASCDLYSHPREKVNSIETRLAEQSGDSARLRLLRFPQADYCFYLSLEDLDNRSRRLTFETYKWDEADRSWHPGWPIVVRLPTTSLKDTPAKDLPIFNKSGTQVASMDLLWVSARVRQADVRYHDVDVDVLTSRKYKTLWNEEDWNKALESAGWSISLSEFKTPRAATGRLDALKKRGTGWTRRRLNKYHNRLIQPIEDAWCYHFLVVKDIAIGDTGRPSGLMYDFANNPDDPSRQGAAIAAERKWEWKSEAKARAKKLMDLPEIFTRTALHELGHMQGLFHNDDESERGLMWPHRRLKALAFDKDKDLTHSDADAFRLWHLPDPWVRPGGLPFGHRYRGSAVDVLKLVPKTPELILKVQARPASVATGASPAVLKLTLKHTFDTAILCPNTRHAQPTYNRLAVTLRTPSGRRLEVWPAHYPREIRAMGGTSLFNDEEIQFRVPWNESFPLNETGVYSFQVHLMWIALDGHQTQTFYRASSERQQLRAT